MLSLLWLPLQIKKIYCQDTLLHLVVSHKNCFQLLTCLWHWLCSGRKQEQLWDEGGMRWNLCSSGGQKSICVDQIKQVFVFIKSMMLLPSSSLSLLFARLAIYQWYRDLAKAHISTMVTIASEGSVNNSNTGAVLVSLWMRISWCMINFFRK